MLLLLLLFLCLPSSFFPLRLISDKSTCRVIMLLLSVPEESHLQYLRHLWYLFDIYGTVEFSEFWYQLGAEVVVSHDIPKGYILQVTNITDYINNQWQ